MSRKYTLDDCVALAEFAHRHQYDKAGEPYIKHPKRVLASVQAQGAQPFVQMAAVLHDVTEDTPFTPQMLIDLGVPEAAVNIVKLLDRNRSALIWENTGDHLGYNVNGVKKWLGFHKEEFSLTKNEYYYVAIRANREATVVKLADIGDNLQPWRLSYLPEETQNRLRAKYAKAIELLEG